MQLGGDPDDQALHHYVSLFGSQLGCASGFAFAETIGRLECSIIGTASPEPIGGRTGHSLASVQFSCFGVDGLLKGAVSTGSNISEWDGPQGTFLSAGESYRAPGGLAVTQLMEGTGSVIMKDGDLLAPKPLEKRSSSLLRAHWLHFQERQANSSASQQVLVGLISS